MSIPPRTFRRSIGRYRRRAVVVFALGLIAAAAIAANWPASSASNPPLAAPLSAATATPSTSRPEDDPASQRAAVHPRQAELQAQLTDLDARLQQMESEQNVREEKIASLTALLAEPSASPAQLEANSLPPPPPPDDSHQQLEALRLREHQLVAKMRDNHPRLLALRQQIADLQAGLPALPRQPAVPKAPTPAPRPLAAAVLAAERTRAETLAAERQSLLATRQGLLRQLATVHSDLAALIALPDRTSPGITEPSATHPAFATAPRAHSAPPLSASSTAAQLPSRRALVLVAGVLAAALLGLATAWVSAVRNPILSAAQQLETIWDLPLTGAIPPDLRLLPATG